MAIDPAFFRKLLLGLRKERGWTQLNLAEHLGCDRAQIAQWEAGARMGDDYVTGLARIIGMDPTELLAVKYALKLQSKGIDITSLLKDGTPHEPEDIEVLALVRSQDYLGLINWATQQLKSQEATPAKESASPSRTPSRRTRSTAAFVAPAASGTE